MLHPVRLTRRHRPWLGLLSLGLGASVLIGVTWWPLRPATSAGTAQPSQPPHEAPSTAAWPQPAMPHQTPAPGAAPNVLSAEQWVRLQQALASHPDREREQARILAFLRFQRLLDDWRAASGRTERAAWARQIVEQLPAHLRAKELLPAEAEALLSELAPDLADQAGGTAAWLGAQKARWQTAESPAEQAERVQARQQDETFTRKANDITTQWLATPPEQRDQAALEQALQSLREHVYER